MIKRIDPCKNYEYMKDSIYPCEHDEYIWDLCNSMSAQISFRSNNVRLNIKGR